MQHIPRSIWLVTVLVAILLGIWLGISIGQPHWIFFGALFGWFFILLELWALLAHVVPTTNHVFLFQWLAAFGYPLAMCGYAACACWTIRSTRSTYDGLAVAAAAVLVSTLASIPAAIVTMSINQHENFFRMLFSYPAALSLHIVIMMNLFVSAVLGWLIAMGLAKLGRGNDAPVKF